jgi:cytochrome c-type protein NapC
MQWLRRWWHAAWTPSRRWAAGTLVLAGAAFAGVGWAGFSTVVERTNTLDFCISCHEMKAFVYEDYAKTGHYENHSGVRAICADCHVPRALVPKLWRKVQATFGEVPHHLLGTIDTEEKFEARRALMAERVWATMKANDSRECRECHTASAMVLADQKPRARGQHEDALTTGETCIDCHKGIAHRLPASAEPDEPAEESFEL